MNKPMRLFSAVSLSAMIILLVAIGLLLIVAGFALMGLNRVEATTHVENRQSQRVLEKLGFQREGVLRAYYRRGSAYTDQIAFSLLRNEWNK